MGDSDDEYDVKRSREKYRRGDQDGDGGNWSDRGSGGRREGGGGGGGGWQRGGPYNNNRNQYNNNNRKQFSPPDRNGAKRRRDWDDDGDDARGDRRGGGGSRQMDAGEGPSGPTQPAMMTFKQYLASLDDSVDDEDAVQRYKEYKIDFKRQQIHDFFLAHKDEEWFRQRYHPEESTIRKQEKQNYMQERLKAFMELVRLGKVDETSLEQDNQAEVVRLLDMAAILMDGGTEEDFKLLDEPKELTDEEKEQNQDNKEKEAGNDNGEGESMDNDEDSNIEQPKKKKIFPKTASIFLRNLPPSITRAEVETICKKFPGFLKLCIAEPLPERRFYRRGWATFEPTVNIKEICWNLSNIRVRDTEMGAIVNREITRRLRSTTGMAGHKPIVRFCIQLAAKIIQNLDNQAGLWGADPNKASEESFMTKSSNPVLKDITDYLIEEGSAEEDEYEGGNRGNDKSAEKDKMDSDDNGPTIERDLELNKVLDRLILYLRIVHSLDFYNYCDYPLEDEMPNRCGIIHVRGAQPLQKVNEEDVDIFTKTLENKLAQWIQPPKKLSKEELEELGIKDAEKEVERFVEANTKKQSEDKWLCPLSGKKFKGPDFIRKHIFNKHAEKVEEVKKDVEYYNNYLLDAKRPSLPEHPTSGQAGRGGPGGPGGPGDRVGGPMPFGHPMAGRLGFPGMPFPMPGPGFHPFMGPMPPFGPMGMPGGFPFDRMGPRRGPFGPRRDGRDVVSYKDLDAPGDDDY